jgi:hypothetical protein
MVAARPPGREEGGIRIGALEVRIVAPAAEAARANPPPAVPPTRPAARVRPAAPLARGFRSFGLVQG